MNSLQAKAQLKGLRLFGLVAVLVAVGLISGCGHIFASARGATLAHLVAEELEEVN